MSSSLQRSKKQELSLTTCWHARRTAGEAPCAFGSRWGLCVIHADFVPSSRVKLLLLCILPANELFSLLSARRTKPCYARSTTHWLAEGSGLLPLWPEHNSSREKLLE